MKLLEGTDSQVTGRRNIREKSVVCRKRAPPMKEGRDQRVKPVRGIGNVNRQRKGLQNMRVDVETAQNAEALAGA